MDDELEDLIDELESLAERANAIKQSGGKVIWEGSEECDYLKVYRPNMFSNGGFYDGNIYICDLTITDIRYAMNAIALYEKVK